jgi:acetyl-CoA C-acetyltransferase
VYNFSNFSLFDKYDLGIAAVAVEGPEVMSRRSIDLTPTASERVTSLFETATATALDALGQLQPQDFRLLTKGWANEITGQTISDHMRETVHT